MIRIFIMLLLPTLLFGCATRINRDINIESAQLIPSEISKKIITDKLGNDAINQLIAQGAGLESCQIRKRTVFLRELNGATFNTWNGTNNQLVLRFDSPENTMACISVYIIDDIGEKESESLILAIKSLTNAPVKQISFQNYGNCNPNMRCRMLVKR
jgi:hypothetical protein